MRLRSICSCPSGYPAITYGGGARRKLFCNRASSVCQNTDRDPQKEHDRKIGYRLKRKSTWRNATRAATITTNPFRWLRKASPTRLTALNVRSIDSRPPARIAACALSAMAWRRAGGCFAVITAPTRRAFRHCAIAPDATTYASIAKL